jgi:hypothetical protein
MRERRGSRLAGAGVPDARDLVPAGGADAGAVGLNAALTTLRGSGGERGLSVPMSQTRAVLSELAVTTRVPSGLNAAHLTLS